LPRKWIRRRSVEYTIYKLNKKRNLILWDDFIFVKETAEELLKARHKEYPKERFFIVKMKGGTNGIR
jgi:hypothetical protein